MKDKQIHFNCPVEASLSLIGGKYKPLILWHLIDQSLHYMELQRLIPNATPKMLSSQLHDLEDCGMIHREVIPEKPPKTIYSLTPFGKSVIPILDALCQWGKNYLDGLDVKSPCCSN
ncbi:winged helix-turn-helix transcriptional regulator [Agathobacter rectalis]|uniref:winged helix-turn-helix transcriptional regulator n=1 Tax=Agathobacter rectalis TaxID=39491 RepID=UPI0032193C30